LGFERQRVLGIGSVLGVGAISFPSEKVFQMSEALLERDDLNVVAPSGGEKSMQSGLRPAIFADIGDVHSFERKYIFVLHQGGIDSLSSQISHEGIKIGGFEENPLEVQVNSDDGGCLSDPLHRSFFSLFDRRRTIRQVPASGNAVSYGRWEGQRHARNWRLDILCHKQ
jgi:hypothetical protein